MIDEEGNLKDIEIFPASGSNVRLIIKDYDYGQDDDGTYC